MLQQTKSTGRSEPLDATFSSHFPSLGKKNNSRSRKQKMCHTLFLSFPELLLSFTKKVRVNITQLSLITLLFIDQNQNLSFIRFSPMWHKQNLRVLFSGIFWSVAYIAYACLNLNKQWHTCIQKPQTTEIYYSMFHWIHWIAILLQSHSLLHTIAKAALMIFSLTSFTHWTFI